MDEATISRLDAVNREFYRAHAASFDAKRRTPWPGWERIAAAVPPLDRTSILDVGCGNGRFGVFLAARLGRDLDYTGVDASRELLAIAASREPARSAGAAGGSWRLLEVDLVRDPGFAAVDGRFDLVTAFGLLHHLPGATTRRRLLEGMASRVAPGGRLAVSFWQFGERSRFTGARRPWASIGLTADAVEEGDYLLPWSGDGSASAGRDVEGSSEGERARYCHWTAPDEAHALVDDLGLRWLDEYRADGHGGDLNLYLLLERP